MEEIKEVLSYGAPQGPEGEKGVIGIPTPVPVLKKRNKPVPVRTLEELDKLDPKKMTDKEKEIYINAIRIDEKYAFDKIAQLEEASKSAFEKARNAEEEINKIKNSANLKLSLVEDNVRVMANNIMTILK